MNLFAQIRKVDEEKRLVYGRAAQEMVDKSNEVMDYESSKPHFQKWSEDISKDTDGKSLGNVRAMHGKIAAGKLTDINFDDGEKAVDICAKIVDDQEWKKVLEGVYTGFSIGGRYIGDKKVEKINGQDVTRYTAGPSEVSLVDRPCIPSARFFEVQKADGTLEKVEFKEAVEEHESEGVVEGTAEEVDELTRIMADSKLNMAKVLDIVKDAVEKKDFSDKQREKDANAGKAMPDGSFPIENTNDLANAIKAYGRAKDPEAVKKHIIERAKALGATKELPEDWGKMEKADMAPKGIGQDKWDSMSAEDKQKYKDGLKAGTEPDGDEDTGSESAAEESVESEKLAKAEIEDALLKLEAAMKNAVEKIGARNSMVDKQRINAIHQAAADLGADCPLTAKAEEGKDLQKVDEAVLQKLVADAIAPLQKELGEAKDKITKLESQPMPARIALRAVSKGEDYDDPDKEKKEVKKVVDSHGEEHEVAGMIKSMHQTGGAPLLKLNQ